MKRYYCASPESGKLDDTESHHCLTVMRQQVGDLIHLFDGQGRELKARIASVKQRLIYFDTLAEEKFVKPTHQICLAQAITKPKSMDWILQKSTEIGLSRIAPIQSDRSVAQIPGERAEHKLSKWRQTTIDAAKQSGQHWLPEILPPTSVKNFVASQSQWNLKLIASLQPEALSLKKTLRDFHFTPESRICFLIGPEGDFTPAEYSEARSAGFLPVSLGSVILRSETAALFVHSAIRYEFDSA